MTKSQQIDYQMVNIICQQIGVLQKEVIVFYRKPNSDEHEDYYFDDLRQESISSQHVYIATIKQQIFFFKDISGSHDHKIEAFTLPKVSNIFKVKRSARNYNAGVFFYKDADNVDQHFLL